MSEQASGAAPARRGSLLSLLVIVCALLAGLAVGRHLGGLETQATVSPDIPSREEQERQLTALRAELEVSRTRHEVDRQALGMLRSEMAAQEEEIAGLEEDLRFYRKLMAPEATAPRITLQAPEFEPGLAPDDYQYRLTVLQRAAKHDPVKGTLEVTLRGQLGGEPVSYSLAAVAEGSEEERRALSFRYFQTLKGSLSLPEGVEVQEVEMRARLTRPRKQEIEAVFPWPLVSGAGVEPVAPLPGGE